MAMRRTMCSICPWYMELPEEWYEIEDTNKSRQLIAICHVITRHPREWEASSGESAESAAARYAEFLRLPEIQAVLRK